MIMLGEEEGVLAGEALLEDALKDSGLQYRDLDSIVATGLGKSLIASAGKRKSDQICHPRGAYELFPSVRTVLDIGAEGSRAMRLDGSGKIEDFAVNSKCASGTGAFLEAMGKIMNLPMEEMGQLALAANGKAKISSYCAVFAESEVISNIHRGVPKEQIISGIHESVVDRLVELLNKVRMEENLVASGGGARNAGLIRALEKRTNLKVRVPERPEMMGALGAALIARDLFQKT